LALSGQSPSAIASPPGEASAAFLDRAPEADARVVAGGAVRVGSFGDDFMARLEPARRHRFKGRPLRSGGSDDGWA
jgi:hypothetical protein